MKIPNIENGKEILYIQLKDLHAVIDIEKNVPGEIKSEIENKINTNLEENVFLKLEQQKTIDFFNSIDWILNYKTFVKSKSHEIEFQYMMAHQRLSLFKSSLDITPYEESTKKEYKISNHKMNDIKQAIQSMVYDNINIPMVEDSDEPTFSIEEFKNYKLQQSLNPNIFLLIKEDKTPASLSDIEQSVIIDIIKFIKKPEDKINVEFYITNTFTITCKINLVKEKIQPKERRKFFKRKNKVTK